jgi:hypothetical protein
MLFLVGVITSYDARRTSFIHQHSILATHRHTSNFHRHKSERAMCQSPHTTIARITPHRPKVRIDTRTVGVLYPGSHRPLHPSHTETPLIRQNQITLYSTSQAKFALPLDSPRHNAGACCRFLCNNDGVPHASFPIKPPQIVPEKQSRLIHSPKHVQVIAQSPASWSQARTRQQAGDGEFGPTSVRKTKQILLNQHYRRKHVR